jgi:hypothetical protein
LAFLFLFFPFLKLFILSTALEQGSCQICWWKRGF